MVRSAVPKHSQVADWARLSGIPEGERWMELAVCFRRKVSVLELSFRTFIFIFDSR
jgi:hypothetical protein